MRKALPLLLSIVLVACLVSCQKTETADENALAQNPPVPTQPGTVQPATPRPAETPRPPAAEPAVEPAVEPVVEPVVEPPAAPPEPPKQNAGLGVIFITDLQAGLFRVKVDDERVYETDFQRDSSRKEEIRVEKELRLVDGKRHLKFVVVDKSSGKIVTREHTVVFAPKSHHVVKLTLTGDDKTIELEMRG